MDEEVTEARKNILNSFLQNLVRISDKDYQKIVWILGAGTEVHDFDEAVCDFFDLGEGIFENYKNYGITDTQYDLLVQFRNAFDAFVYDSKTPCLPQELIETPEWERIMVMAKEILKAFKFPTQIHMRSKLFKNKIEKIDG